MLSVAVDTASAALPLPHSPVHGYSPVTPAYNHHQAPNHHLYAMTPAYPAYGYRREMKFECLMINDFAHKVM